MPIEDCWYGCYQEGLKGWLVDAAFAHPAKVSLSLAKRIYAHAIEEGWIIPGKDVCLDPMAGVGTFGLVAASLGIQAVCLELEPRFVEITTLNIDLHRKEWTMMSKPIPYVMQGDARQLRDIITEAGLICTSPPYANGCRQTGEQDLHPEHIQGGHNGHVLRSYDEPTAIISSPPYANSVNAESCGIDWTKMSPATGNRQRGPGTKHYETLKAQLSYQPAAVVTSPPFLDARQDTTRPRPPKSMDRALAEKNGRIHRLGACEYGSNSGQLGSMKEGSLAAIISSPPYSEGLSKEHTYHNHEKRNRDSHQRIMTEKGIVDLFYGVSDGNIGLLNQDTYWSAMASIYRQCWEILPHSGHIILVLKGFVRRWQYVDLPAQTAQLLTHVGFTVEHAHKAMLTSQVGQLTLDGGEDRKSRKSFFRRLAEQKGAPVIDFEIVLCAQK